MESAEQGWKNLASGGTLWMKRKEFLHLKQEEEEAEAPQRGPEQETSTQGQMEKRDKEKVPG